MAPRPREDEGPPVGPFRMIKVKICGITNLADASDLERMGAYPVAAFLLDSRERWSEGEVRRPIQWTLARAASARGRIILSAGLTPDNVAEAIAVARPYGVDVNSGVEAAPGRKDPVKLRDFIAAAKQA